MFVIGIVMGPGNDRYEVTAMEFTSHQVRLVTRAGVRTLEVADVIRVTVTHSGLTDEGYKRTSLEVTWCDGKESIDSVHDVTLAPSLSRLLPPGVEVRDAWESPESSP
ncbi:hypothetical protein ITP53_15765 [Nonomuraea sp. K274]|uniref:Uncharacterized protein n=1 Tax=Nonomuraea cypriaca TaxID=1187855 RepID=A0A931A6B2_9ACTN|nr:hypothetical protein [Nonomuraea cypriaca]MBF8187166.1 hypothetical protein [Nonomuraea cypriaca]